MSAMPPVLASVDQAGAYLLWGSAEQVLVT